MSKFLTTAVLVAAVIAGSTGMALAQESATKVKPCIGDLCPPASPTDDMPKQTVTGAHQDKQVQGQDQTSGQVTPRKKKQASLHRDRQQPSSGQVMPREKKQASLHRKRQLQQQGNKSASRSGFWDWLF